MNRVLNLFFLAMAFCIAVPSSAQETPPDSLQQQSLASDITISLLIAEPGDDIYSAYGHCALRAQCPSAGLDYCFTYGMVDTFENSVKFFFGSGRGTYSSVRTSLFLEDYIKEGRGVKEYVINFTLDQKRELWRMLDEEVRSTSYRQYNYLLTNCSCMCVLAIEKALGTEHIEYHDLDPALTGTYRTFIHALPTNQPWTGFFWTSLLAKKGEEKGELYTKLSPKFIVPTFQKAEIVNEATGERRPVFLGEPNVVIDKHLEITPAFIPPVYAFSLFILISLIISVMQVCGVGRKVVIGYDILLLSAQTFVGLVFFFLSTLSQLDETAYYWHLAMFNPLPIVLMYFRKRRPNIFRKGFTLFSISVFAYIVSYPVAPQILLPHALMATGFFIRAIFYSDLGKILLRKKAPVTSAVTILALLFTLPAEAQRFFVDGFHGGVYGHYPMKTYTQFLYDQLKQHPDWYIGLEIEPETWDTVRAKTPQAYELFRSVAGSRQVEYTNPSYAQSYLYCIQGESIIRQFQMGMKKLRSHFPDMRIETYAGEEPCFTSCLPTLLPQLGFKYMVLKCPNTCWGGYSRNFGGQFVNVLGPDGTGIITVPRYECEELEPNSVWQTTAWGNTDRYWKACQQAGIEYPVAMTYQDAGWTNGPWIGYGDKQNGTIYTLWSDYFNTYVPKAHIPDYRLSQEDVMPGLMWGSQVMQRLAQEVRKSENILTDAEKRMSIQAIADGRHIKDTDTEEMAEAWRTLLLSQHHDCWIVPYNRLNSRGNWAENVTLWTESSNQIAQKLAANETATQGKKKGWKLYNTLPYPRKDIVCANGQTYAVSLPAFGYATVTDNDMVKAKPTKSIKVDGDLCYVENNMYSICFDLKHGGVAISIKTKSDGYEYADANGEFAFGELRGFFKDDNAFRSSTEQPAQVRIIQDNTLMKQIELQGSIAGTPFVKTITLKDGDPAIAVSLTINWDGNHAIGDYDFAAPKRNRRDRGPVHVNYHDTRYMLNVLMPNSLGKSKIVKDAPYDVCESKLDNTFYNRWDSIKHNVILNWVDQEGCNGRSLAVFTDHTTSYSYGQDFPLALTLQYSGPGLWGRNYIISRPTTITYHVMPHTGNWEQAHLQKESDRLNTPVCLSAVSKVEATAYKSLLSLEGTGYNLSAFTTEGDTSIMRLFNAEGDDTIRDIALPSNIISVEQVDLQGNTICLIPVNNDNGNKSIKISMPRFGVSTYRIKQ